MSEGLKRGFLPISYGNNNYETKHNQIHLQHDQP